MQLLSKYPVNKSVVILEAVKLIQMFSKKDFYYNFQIKWYQGC